MREKDTKLYWALRNARARIIDVAYDADLERDLREIVDDVILSIRVAADRIDKYEGEHLER